VLSKIFSLLAPFATIKMNYFSESFHISAKKKYLILLYLFFNEIAMKKLLIFIILEKIP
jgi:hypothetical protein